VHILHAPAHTSSRTRVRAFNALTPQGRATTLTRLGITPRRCSANSRGRPSPPLFSTVRQGRCQLRDTVSPTPVRLTRRALEGGPVAPSNIFYVLIQGHAVMSGQRDRSSPSLSALCGHPRHCRTTRGHCGNTPSLLGCTGTRHRHNGHCATYRPSSTAPSSRPTTAAGQPTATPLPSKPPLYEHRTHHDASTGAGFARTAVSSAALLAIPRREIVRHACKLLPSWPIKGGAAPSRGDTGRRVAITHTPSVFSTILALASINTSGTWRPCLLSRFACSHPSTSTTVQVIQCREHAACGRTAPAGTRINQVSLVA
jgi:hypothetical protein